MARGFRTTLGVNTTDCVAVTLPTTPTGTKISFASWFYFAADTTNMYLFRIASSVGAAQLSMASSGGTVLWRRAYSGGTWPVRFNSNTLDYGNYLNQWSHWVMTHDISADVTTLPVVYVNGVAQTTDSSSPSGTPSAMSAVIGLGNISGGDTNALNGAMAESGIWDNRILTPAEVADLAGGYSPQWFPENLLLHTPLNGDEIGELPGVTTITGTLLRPHIPIILPPPPIFYSIGVALSGTQIVEPDNIASSEVFGSPQINFTIAPDGIASSEAFGSPQINFTIEPNGIASSEAFGSPQINFIVQPDGIASSEAFGSPQINFTIEPDGIGSSEAVGTPTLVTEGTISPAGIASSEAFGSPQINFTIAPDGIASSEAFGSPQINFTIEPNGIASSEALGSPTIVTTGTQIVQPTGIPSSEALGSPTVIVSGVQVIALTGIASSEAFGTPLIIDTDVLFDRAIAVLTYSFKAQGVLSYTEKPVATVE